MLRQSYLSLSCWDPKTSEHLNLEEKFPVISFSKELWVRSYTGSAWLFSLCGLCLWTGYSTHEAMEPSDQRMCHHCVITAQFCLTVPSQLVHLSYCLSISSATCFSFACLPPSLNLSSPRQWLCESPSDSSCGLVSSVRAQQSLFSKKSMNKQMEEYTAAKADVVSLMFLTLPCRWNRLSVHSFSAPLLNCKILLPFAENFQSIPKSYRIKPHFLNWANKNSMRVPAKPIIVSIHSANLVVCVSGIWNYYGSLIGLWPPSPLRCYSHCLKNLPLPLS